MENLLLLFQTDSNSAEGAGNEKVYFGHQVLIDEVLKLLIRGKPIRIAELPVKNCIKR